MARLVKYRWRSRARRRAAFQLAGRAWILSGCALPGCTAFASSKDALEGEAVPAHVGAGTGVAPIIPSVGARPLLPKPYGVSALGAGATRNESEAAGPLELLDAGSRERLGPGSSEALDAGALELLDAGEREQPDAFVPRACAGTGEFPSASGSGCYLWVAQAASWENAQASCLFWGGALARIDSAADDQLLTDHMSIDSWIGANDRTAEGAFRWTDASVLTFTNWAVGEPNNAAGPEDCVAKLAKNARWNDEQCGNVNAYFCERPLR
jgi:hypothetical protein